MPGSGKSTVGVLLAKATRRDFVDTDVSLQAKEGRGLQEIIDVEGLAAFRRIEERHILSLDCRASVIATGGSVVYYPAAMNHLASSGIVFHLDLDLSSLTGRLLSLGSRGVVMDPGQTLNELFEERKPLYRKYARFTIPCSGRTHEEIVKAIVAELEKIGKPQPGGEEPR